MPHLHQCWLLAQGLLPPLPLLLLPLLPPPPLLLSLPLARVAAHSLRQAHQSLQQLLLQLPLPPLLPPLLLLL